MGRICRDRQPHGEGITVLRDILERVRLQEDGHRARHQPAASRRQVSRHSSDVIHGHRVPVQVSV